MDNNELAELIKESTRTSAAGILQQYERGNQYRDLFADLVKQSSSTLQVILDNITEIPTDDPAKLKAQLETAKQLIVVFMEFTTKFEGTLESMAESDEQLDRAMHELQKIAGTKSPSAPSV